MCEDVLILMAVAVAWFASVSAVIISAIAMAHCNKPKHNKPKRDKCKPLGWVLTAYLFDNSTITFYIDSDDFKDIDDGVECFRDWLFKENITYRCLAIDPASVNYPRPGKTDEK